MTEQTKASPDLSILIVTWESGAFIGRCLDSLQAACGGLSWELVVHDNDSSDSTLAEIRARDGQHVVLIEAKANLGFAGGLNSALSRCRGRYVLLLNPDCVAPEGSIERLVRHLEDHPGLAGVAPLLVDESGEPQRDFQLKRLPRLSSLVAEILLLNRLFPGNRYSSSHLYREAGLDGRPVEIEQPAGAAILLRREVIDEIGPFDERFHPAWFEDVDYCRRLHDHGSRLHLVPGVVIRHRGGSSLTKMDFAEFLPIWYRNLHRYAAKWMSKGAAEVIRWAIMGGAVLRIAALLVGRARMSVDRSVAVRANRAALAEAWHRWPE